MSSITIKNPEADPQTAGLVTKVFDSIPVYWKRILPGRVEVVVSTTPFNKVPELKGFCAFQNRRPDWNKGMWESTEAICPAFNQEEATIWVYFFRGASYLDPEYYFQKHLYEAISKLMWMTSEELRKKVCYDKELAPYGGRAYWVFRDSFSRFFLNPEWLKERRETAWQFMRVLDAAFRKQGWSVVK